MKKLYYLEGIRGIAAFIVVISHFVQVFYSYLLGLDSAAIHSRFESEIVSTPLNILYNGNFAVCIFFVLSGYVLSYKFFNKKDTLILIESAAKRYFRLAIPVVTSLLFAFVILKMNWFYYGEIMEVTKATMTDFYAKDMSFFQILKEGIYSTFFKGVTSLNPVLWTMYYELFGSFLIFSFLALFGKLKNRYLFYIVLCIYFWNTYFLAFALGMILCDLVVNFEINKKINNKFLVAIIIISGLFLGSYPYINVTGTIYEFLIINPEWEVDYFTMYHILGAVLLLVGVIGSEVIQKILSINIFRFLGNISFSLYLVHFIILCSFSSFIFKEVISTGVSYNISFLITFIPSLILIFIISYVMYKFVDSKTVGLSKWLYERIFKSI